MITLTDDQARIVLRALQAAQKLADAESERRGDEGINYEDNATATGLWVASALKVLEATLRSSANEASRQQRRAEADLKVGFDKP